MRLTIPVSFNQKLLVIKHTDTKSCAPDLVVTSTYPEPAGWDEVWGIAPRGFAGSLGQSCW